MNRLIAWRDNWLRRSLHPNPVPVPSEPKCQFYGKCASPTFGLVAQHGNQCALVINAFSPCTMELKGAEPLWSKCPRVPDATDAAIHARKRVNLGVYNPIGQEDVTALLKLIQIQQALERPR